MVFARNLEPNVRGKLASSLEVVDRLRERFDPVGVVGLQGSQESQDQLVAAFRARSREKGRAMGDVFLGRRDLDPERAAVTLDSVESSVPPRQRLT
jgi:hypothetical protein